MKIVWIANDDEIALSYLFTDGRSGGVPFIDIEKAKALTRSELEGVPLYRNDRFS